MRDTNLAVHNVTVSFGARNAKVRALDNVTLDFRPGYLTLVMGPSGSGKTTLLSLLGCLRSPDQGSVFVEGCEVNQLPERKRCEMRRRIGFVFQAFRLFHALPAVENVSLAADIGGGVTDKSKAAWRALELVGLGAKSHLKPDALSGGEKQRVAIARALLLDPAIVLADEPTASLDSQSGRQVCKLLRQIAIDQKRTVVVVSHDDRWRSFADRIIRLQDGRVADDHTQSCAYTLELEAAPSLR